MTAHSTGASDAIPRAARDGALPLSANQEGRLSLEALAARANSRGAAPYHIVRGLQVEGPLDLSALQTALSDLVKRHEILRTGFVAPSAARGEIDGRPSKHAVLQPTDWRTRLAAVGRHEFDDLTPVDRQARSKAIARAAVMEPFDYARPPLMRAVVVRLSAAEHLLILRPARRPSVLHAQSRRLR